MKYGTLVQGALARKRQQRETLREDVLKASFAALNRLADRVGFDDALLFGSVVQPSRFREGSDVDIGFWNLDNQDFFFTIAFLSRELGRDVDVIQLEQAGQLQQKILREGVSWKKQT